MRPNELATYVLLRVLETIAGDVHEPNCPHLDDYVGAFISVAYGDGIHRPNVWEN